MSPSLRRLKAVLKKEWLVLLTSTSNLLYLTVLPVAIVAQALLYIWLIHRFAGRTLVDVALIEQALARLVEAVPAVGALEASQQLQVLLLHQFVFYLMLIPAVTAMGFAAFSIVEEKQSGSLEPLLATPLRTWELLLGKALWGAIPAVLMTWLAAAVVVLGVGIMGWGSLLPYVLQPTWFMSLFLLTPGVAALSFLLGVLASSRASDAKSAQNMGVVIILPVIGLVALQVTGTVWFTSALMLLVSLGTAAAAVLTLRVAVRLFQREAILVRWR